MLSIQNVKSAQQAIHYYGKEDYYLGRSQEAPTGWWGNAAEKLGIAGNAVDLETFHDALLGKLPGGIELPSRFDGQRRAATDLTFSAPKSVSIEALVNDRAEMRQAHEHAVSEALKYLEERAANTRIRQDGKTVQVATDNLLVARFQHHTSRALDPQLHTHAVVLNITHAENGQWRALVNTDLYEHKMAAGLVYRAALAQRVQELGYGVQITGDKGEWELAGFSRDQIEKFSKRRADIVEALSGELGEKLDSLGVTGARAAKAAALATRSVKREVDPDALRALWCNEAKDAGINPQTATQNVATGAKNVKEAVAWAFDHLHERKAVVEEREVMQHALRAGMGRLTRHDVQEEIVAIKVGGDVLVVGERRENQERYTTKGMLHLESKTIDIMRAGQGTRERLMAGWMAETRLEGAGLTAGQTAAVTTIVDNRDLVVGIQGYAGTGKTTMLGKVREFAEEAGYTLKGMSVSSQAAKVLADGTGISSTTVTAHLRTCKTSDARELWVVDESSFLSTHQAHALLAAAQRIGTRIVLLGDRDQLPSVEAGRPFAELSDRGMRVAVMDQIVRQTNVTAKNAVERTIDRDYSGALSALVNSVTEITKHDARMAHVADAYLSRDRSNTLVITASNPERRDLNERIRTGLIARGDVSHDGVQTEVLIRRDATAAELKRSTVYEEGNIVRFNQNYERFGVKTGEYWTVGDRDNRGGVQLTNGARKVTWIPSRAAKVELFTQENRELAVGDQIRWTRNDHAEKRRNGETATVVATETNALRLSNGTTLDIGKQKHWEHAYAITVHASQGATCNTVIAHLNTQQVQLTGHESWYVGISRARENIVVITDDKQNLPDKIARMMTKESALAEHESHQGKSRFNTRGDVLERSF